MSHRHQGTQPEWRRRPEPLQPARLIELEESALAAAGIERTAAAPLAHYARRVVVEVFGLESAAGNV